MNWGVPVSYQSLHFISQAKSKSSKSRSHLNQHITYQSSKSLKELLPTFTLTLTHWTLHYIYIALPLLSSSPKTVRLALHSTEPDSAPCEFQTLRNPLYFPASTSYRNPQLYIHSSKAVDAPNPCAPVEHLVLAVDPDVSQKSELQRTSSMNSPMPIIWSISEKNTWQDWTQEKDE